MKIGKVRLESKYILAPLHGVNCPAFRLLCKRHGAGLVYTPMIHSLGLVKGDKDAQLFEVWKEEKPVTVQLIGNDPKIMAESVQFVEEDADIIDINFGCPDGDVCGQKMGAYLAKHPDKIPKLISAVVGATNKPVTAKIRSGWDDASVNCVKVAKMIEDAGTDAIALHARTRKQQYTGKADWGLIRQVKEQVEIPVIGNGDVWNHVDAARMVEKTGCDMVMIGRGAIGYPFVFKECVSGKNYHPGVDERRKVMMDFVELHGKQKRQPFSELKQHMMWLCTKMKGASKLRKDFMLTDDIEEVKKIIQGL